MPIEIENVSCSYVQKTKFEVKALDDVSFSVADGEFVGIMGRTGCGKSTLVQLIAGLISPSGGTVSIDGRDINAPDYDRGILRETVGIVFQYPECQLFETTVEKEVAFALKHRALTKDEKSGRVKWALEAMGFSYGQIGGESPMTLSGGEKRRVAIAGVLAAKPKIIIFDEPVAGLDPYGRADFLALAKKLNKEGTTILMVSHNADALCECAGRILVLDHGRVAADGTPKEIFKDLDRAKELHIGAGNVRMIAQGLYDRGILPTPEAAVYHELLEQVKAALKEGGFV